MFKFISRAQRKVNLEITIRKLELLAGDFQKGRDRVSDYPYWVDSMDRLRELTRPGNLVEEALYQSYHTLFSMLKEKYQDVTS